MKEIHNGNMKAEADKTERTVDETEYEYNLDESDEYGGQIEGEDSACNVCFSPLLTRFVKDLFRNKEDWPHRSDAAWAVESRGLEGCPNRIQRTSTEETTHSWKALERTRSGPKAMH